MRLSCLQNEHCNSCAIPGQCHLAAGAGGCAVSSEGWTGAGLQQEMLVQYKLQRVNSYRYDCSTASVFLGLLTETVQGEGRREQSTGRQQHRVGAAMGDAFIRHIELLGYEKRFFPSQHYVSAQLAAEGKSLANVFLEIAVMKRLRASLCGAGGHGNDMGWKQPEDETPLGFGVPATC